MLVSSFLNESKERQGRFEDFFATFFLRGDIYKTDKICINMVTNLIRFKLVHKNKNKKSSKMKIDKQTRSQDHV